VVMVGSFARFWCMTGAVDSTDGPDRDLACSLCRNGDECITVMRI
jgi:hypothetical protein